LGFRGCGKTRVHGGCGKGMTSVVPLNRAESVALQRLRFAVRPLAEFFRSLFSRAIKPSLKRGHRPPEGGFPRGRHELRQKLTPAAEAATLYVLGGTAEAVPFPVPCCDLLQDL
jgi:hypothetical protein